MALLISLPQTACDLQCSQNADEVALGVLDWHSALCSCFSLTIWIAPLCSLASPCLPSLAGVQHSGHQVWRCCLKLSAHCLAATLWPCSSALSIAYIPKKPLKLVSLKMSLFWIKMKALKGPQIIFLYHSLLYKYTICINFKNLVQFCWYFENILN